jgi:hypothetical protein
MMLHHSFSLARSFFYTRSGLSHFSSYLLPIHLSKILSKELEYIESAKKPNDSLNSFLKVSGFQLHDQEAQNSVVLTKNLANIQLTITFAARLSLKPSSSPNFTNFQAKFTNTSNKSCVIFECVAQDSCIHILSIKNNCQNTYKGPYFSSLDESLQASCIDFLKSSSINSDLSIFIEFYSLSKAHQLYQSWLKNVSFFLSSP